MSSSSSSSSSSSKSCHELNAVSILCFVFFVLFFVGGGRMGLLSFFSAGELLVLLLTCMNELQRASLEQCMHEFWAWSVCLAVAAAVVVLDTQLVVWSWMCMRKIGMCMCVLAACMCMRKLENGYVCTCCFLPCLVDVNNSYCCLGLIWSPSSSQSSSSSLSFSVWLCSCK